MHGDFEFVCVYRQTDGLSLPLRRQAGIAVTDKTLLVGRFRNCSPALAHRWKRCKQQEKQGQDQRVVTSLLGKSGCHPCASLSMVSYAFPFLSLVTIGAVSSRTNSGDFHHT